MVVSQKKSRLEYLFDLFEKDYERAVKNGVYTNDTHSKSKEPQQFDPNILNFFKNNSIPIVGEDAVLIMFNYFVDCDPTNNKEYLGWILNMYRKIIKTKIKNKKKPDDADESIEAKHATFFEDLLSKVKWGLEVHSFLKKTKAFNVKYRDINFFQDINDFVKFIKPYTITSTGDDSVHTLDHKELTHIKNFTEKNQEYGQAELVFENDEWVIVITHDKQANIEFGKYTSWCTSGTRYLNAFNDYHTRGELFVLIKKGFGSKKSIDADPTNRMQFHFEDEMFMDANDDAIEINEFLSENQDIKNYFTDYIVDKVIPYKHSTKDKLGEILKYLGRLGYSDSIIRILKKYKPTELDLTGFKIGFKFLHDLGEVVSIEHLTLSGCSITELPESLKSLTKLKFLEIRNNKDLKSIPDWIGSFGDLQTLDCAGCGIEYIGNISNLKNLRELILDYNPKLKYLPKGIGNLTKLNKLLVTNCDLREVYDDILNCTDLYIVDMARNKSLRKIPTGLSKLPNIVAICIDSTNISDKTKKTMEDDSNGEVCIIKY